MTAKKILFIFSFLCGIAMSCAAQQYPNAQDAELQRQNEEVQRIREQRELQQRRRDLENVQNIRSANKTVPPKIGLSEKDKTRREKMVAPDAEDLTLLKDFLKQPDTGIFRLFPDYDCLEKGVVKVSGKCENIFPGTWFYSFRRKDYSDDLLSDIQFKNGKLITDGFLSQGLITELGNFSLDDVNLESKGAKFINDFKPAVKSSDIKTQYDQFGKGIESDGYRYSKEVNAKLGEIYLMRVIAYHLQSKLTNKISGLDSADSLKLLALEQDKREDVTIAFRIIRKDADGSLTIISKKLAGKKSPEIIFEETSRKTSATQKH